MPLTLGLGSGCDCHPGPARQGLQGAEKPTLGHEHGHQVGKDRAGAGAAVWALPRPPLPRLGRSAPSHQFPAFEAGRGKQGWGWMGVSRGEGWVGLGARRGLEQASWSLAIARVAGRGRGGGGAGGTPSSSREKFVNSSIN